MDNGLENTRKLINNMLDSQKPQSGLNYSLNLDSTSQMILANRIKDIYILVHWPDSQHFMDKVWNFPTTEDSKDGDVFIPIQVYLDKIKELGE